MRSSDIFGGEPVAVHEDDEGSKVVAGEERKRLVRGRAGLISVVHNLDDEGNPAGGASLGWGFDINWQNGPLGRGEERSAPNGAFVEDVVIAALDRMRFYQSTRFRCRENALVITKLEEALHWMNHRTADRGVRGVKGTHST